MAVVRMVPDARGVAEGAAAALRCRSEGRRFATHDAIPGGRHRSSGGVHQCSPVARTACSADTRSTGRLHPAVAMRGMGVPTQPTSRQTVVQARHFI